MFSKRENSDISSTIRWNCYQFTHLVSFFTSGKPVDFLKPLIIQKKGSLS